MAGLARAQVRASFSQAELEGCEGKVHVPEWTSPLAGLMTATLLRESFLYLA